MIEYPCSLGGSIVEHYASTVKLAKETKETYYFEGNGIIFIANEHSDEKLAEKYLEKAYSYDIEVIGPNEPMMTDEYKKKKEEEKRIKLEETMKQMAIEKENEEKDKQIIEKIIKNEVYKFSEGTENKYHEGYKKQSSGYGRACFDYASDLAKYLQTISPDGIYTLDDVEKGENLIRHYGISGFQHGCVKAILKETWKFYNEEVFEKL